MSAITLYELAGQYRELLNMDDIPPEQITDTLNALQGDIQDKATNIALVVGNLDNLADSIEEAAKAMKARANAARNRADWLRSYLLVNMKATGISKIESPMLRISLRKNPGKVVVDFVDSIPAEFMRIPPAPPPEPDKKAIADALKAGQDVPGAHLEQSERVEIKP